MSLSIANRVLHTKPSDTLVLSSLANQLKAQGKPIINLTVGEPDFKTPEFVRAAVIKALEQGQYSKYTPVEGTGELKNAIIKKFQRDNQLNYHAKEVMVSTGAKQAIYNVMQAVLNSEDEVIILAPYWVSYPSMASLACAKVVTISAGIEQQFKITPDQLAKAITSRTRLLILNSPSNPTGVIYTREELEALGRVLEPHKKLIIISDDIYEAVYWAKADFCNIVQACPYLKDRTIVINGVSKAYAMTGWRIGYAAGPQELIEAMTTVQSQSTSCPNALAQFAAQVALNSELQFSENNKIYQHRQQILLNAMSKIPGVECLPIEGAFYSFPSFKAVLENASLKTDEAFAKYLLEEFHLATVPGSSFGAPGHLRLSFALDEVSLQEAMERLARACQSIT